VYLITAGPLDKDLQAALPSATDLLSMPTGLTKGEKCAKAIEKVLLPIGMNATSVPPRPDEDESLPRASPLPIETIYTKEALQDEIISPLPGYKDDTDFRQFSGYLPITSSKNIFYWYVEAVDTPESAPLVFWTNGGPGCSGLFGFLAEHGPFRPLEDGQTLVRNPYSWNRVANMLYVEQPVTVGFSYSSEQVDKAAFGDDQSALDNFRVIQSFLSRYPHLRSHELYLSGESYGGHYLPSLARFILDKNAAPDPTSPPLNLQGFLVGNPSTDPVFQLLGQVETLEARRLLPPALSRRWADECAAIPTVVHLGSMSCMQLQREILEAVEALDLYSISTAPCRLVLDAEGLALGERVRNATAAVASAGASQAVKEFVRGPQARREGKGTVGSYLGDPKLWTELVRAKGALSAAAGAGEREPAGGGPVDEAAPAGPADEKVSPRAAPSPARERGSGAPQDRRLRPLSPSLSAKNAEEPAVGPGLPTAAPLAYDSCQAVYGARYLNRADVKAALHASEDVAWEDCSFLVLANFRRSDWSTLLEPTFKSLVGGEKGEGERTGLRVLLYSGDDDTVCSSRGTELWLESLAWGAERAWAPWFVRGAAAGGREGGREALPAGMMTKYKNGLVFATLEGAGHAVPSFKPREAFFLFSEYLYDRL